MTRVESREETALRTALADLAEVLAAPGTDALRAIRDLFTSKNGAPGWNPGTPNRTAVYLKGHTAMSIIHHEDASLYGKGVIHHPLSGRPEFKGLVDGADGPAVRIQDGDLVLTIDSVDTLLRWREVFRLAAVQLERHIAATGGAA
ncbi:hypothetical protein [Spirillospora sp. NBC_01491]|uniref:hypothetical protein n=1 Tax=Spirillospora sp. NBC_01491 TaxID=2976007 RepID=UPI002E36B927|nr:hypothetical protein [Spirillospora sp. NBC_01491]